MAGSRDVDFLDLVYDAALDASLWPAVMTQVADQVGGTGAWLSQLNVFDGSGGHLDDPVVRIDPIWQRAYVEYFAERNPFATPADPRGFLERWRPRVLTLEDQLPREALIRTEYCNEFMVPQDASSALMIRLARNGPETATLNIQCPARKNRFSDADIALAERLQPDLIRAFDLGRKLAEARAGGGEPGDLFDASHHGLFLVDGAARIRRVNRTGEAMLAAGDALIAPAGRLTGATDAGSKRLQALIGEACGRERRVGGAMTISTPSRRRPVSLSVAPVRAERSWPFHIGPTALVCATDLEARVPLPAQTLRGLFGLTSAEARVAMAVFEGESVAEIAAQSRVSVQTVRNHLARAFDKTDTRRQSELSSLLMRLVGAPAN